MPGLREPQFEPADAPEEAGHIKTRGWRRLFTLDLFSAEWEKYARADGAWQPPSSMRLLYRAREALYSIIKFETLSQSPPPTSLRVARHVPFHRARRNAVLIDETAPLPRQRFRPLHRAFMVGSPKADAKRRTGLRATIVALCNLSCPQFSWRDQVEACECRRQRSGQTCRHASLKVVATPVFSSRVDLRFSACHSCVRTGIRPSSS